MPATIEKSPDVVIRPNRPGDDEFGNGWKVIVLNDNHNTFQGVAMFISKFIPGCDLNKGMEFAQKIHNTGRAVVWSGAKEPAELYHEQLGGCGLTMGPLEN